MTNLDKQDPARVIIAEDHIIFRDGLRLLLENNPTVKFVGEAPNGKILVDLVKMHKPDVVLTDLCMPVMGGVEAIQKINCLPFKVQCIGISTFEYEQLIIQALEAGAMGYLSKNADREEIIEAIHTVSGNYYYYCRRTTNRMIKHLSLSKYNSSKKESPEGLTEKEVEIIRLICMKKTSKEIGEQLFLSKKAIDKYRINILQKINEKTSVGIVLYAIKTGIFTIDELNNE